MNERPTLRMDQKRCPYCGEEILAVAIKCKHCGSGLTPEALVAEQDPTTTVRMALAERYEVVAELGHGGNATVFQAIQKNLDRNVALKVLHPQLTTDKEFIERFHQEARAIAKLHHPNIVVIYDEGVVNNVHFMAMEYLEGSDLHRLVERRGRLPFEEVARFCAQVAGALDFAHKHGVIHRDVKSSNIILTMDRGAVLTDFGIAHAGFGAPLTAAGTVLGTPEFMSPEQADGRTVDERSDFFSLGVVMYNALTGKFPFRGTNPLSTIYKILNEPYPPISSEVRVPAYIETAVTRCLEKKPDVRVQSGAEIISLLRSPEQRPSRWKWSRHKVRQESPAGNGKIIVALVASIVLCCAVLGVLLWPPSRFEGGTSASTDSTIVRLPVDNGAPRRVPDVRGMTLIDARRELERAGFVIESLEHMTYPDPSRHNRVDSQLPLAGDTARAGSGVTLTIAQLPTAGQKTAQ